MDLNEVATIIQFNSITFGVNEYRIQELCVINCSIFYCSMKDLYL